MPNDIDDALVALPHRRQAPPATSYWVGVDRAGLAAASAARRHQMLLPRTPTPDPGLAAEREQLRRQALAAFWRSR